MNSWAEKYLILVIDDDIQMVTMVCTALQTEGYRTDFATNAMSAKEKAWAIKPDLIVTDIMMPGVNGLAMMEQITQHPDLAQIPTIFLSGSASSNAVPDASDPTQRYALLKKPVFLPELNQLVRRFLTT